MNLCKIIILIIWLINLESLRASSPKYNWKKSDAKNLAKKENAKFNQLCAAFGDPEQVSDEDYQAFLEQINAPKSPHNSPRKATKKKSVKTASPTADDEFNQALAEHEQIMFIQELEKSKVPLKPLPQVLKTCYLFGASLVPATSTITLESRIKITPEPAMQIHDKKIIEVLLALHTKCLCKHCQPSESVTEEQLDKLIIPIKGTPDTITLFSADEAKFSKSGNTYFYKDEYIKTEILLNNSFAIYTEDSSSSLSDLD